MRQVLSSIIIVLSISVFVIFGVELFIGNSWATYLHHYNYLFFSVRHLLVLVPLLILFAYSLIATINSKFNQRLFNLLLLLSVVGFLLFFIYEHL